MAAGVAWWAAGLPLSAKICCYELGRRICSDAANTGCDAGGICGFMPAGQRVFADCRPVCAGGPSPPRHQSLLLRIVAFALGLVFFALGFGLGSHFFRSRLFAFAFFGFGFLAGRLGGLVFVCRTLA